MVRALAFALLIQNDSAVVYARRVLPQTENPRYLDDIYYILMQCDSSVVADDLRLLSSKRADVQRSLERNNPEWMEAIRIAETSLQPQQPPMKPGFIALLIAIPMILLTILTILFLRWRKRRRDSIENQCRILRQSPNLREELQWNDYPQFSAICNQRLGGIVTKLENRELTEREIRICVLVLIGLSYAQMAEVLFRAESGIGKDKYLVAKHLGVSVKDLQNTLRNIAHEPLHA
jgi:DNA-binding CsgD family transcriptional regulator